MLINLGTMSVYNTFSLGDKTNNKVPAVLDTMKISLTDCQIQR